MVPCTLCICTLVGPDEYVQRQTKLAFLILFFTGFPQNPKRHHFGAAIWGQFSNERAPANRISVRRFFWCICLSTFRPRFQAFFSSGLRPPRPIPRSRLDGPKCASSQQSSASQRKPLLTGAGAAGGAAWTSEPGTRLLLDLRLLALLSWRRRGCSWRASS